MSKITNQSSLTSKYTLPDNTQKESEVQSNISSTEYMTDSFTKVRSSAKDFGSPGDELVQTLVLTNNSEYEITNIRVIDTIGDGATFKDGTLEVKGVARADESPITGFTIDSMAQNDSVTVTYTITIDSLPTTDVVNLVSDITYSVNEATDLTEKSNIVSIDIGEQVVTITKTSDMSVVISGQTLTFQNTIRNNGDYVNTDLVFKDPIPAGTTFITDSVEINNEIKPGLDPSTGFPLDDLNPGDEIVVRFKVKVG